MDPASIGILAANVVSVITPFLASAAEKIVPQASEDIYQAIKGHYDCESLGPMRFKGKADRLKVYSLRGPLEDANGGEAEAEAED